MRKKQKVKNAHHRRHSNAPEIELDDEDEEKAVGTQVHPSHRPQVQQHLFHFRTLKQDQFIKTWPEGGIPPFPEVG